MNPDLVVIGAGMVGAACAYYASAAGLSVTVLERGAIVSGTSGAGEGNILVSDKAPGPELDLALYSNELWRELSALPADRPGTGTVGDLIEFEEKGGLIVAGKAGVLAAITERAIELRQAGVQMQPLGTDQLPDYEPHLATGLAGGIFYPQDLQVQPMLAAAHLLSRARRANAIVHQHRPVTALLRKADRVTGVRTPAGDIHAGAVLNAAGPWADAVAELARVHVPIAPRRGFVLVTEPVPVLVRHKVYAGEYATGVASDSAALQCAAVVESTKSGTVLIGATRERVGFDRQMSLAALAKLARGAIELFPVLSRVSAIRAYRGFRPFSPDHLPVIGPDPRAPGLWHACGHEGAGIGLSLGTGKLVAQALSERGTDLPLHPFRPERFDEHTGGPHD